MISQPLSDGRVEAGPLHAALPAAPRKAGFLPELSRRDPIRASSTGTSPIQGQSRKDALLWSVLGKHITVFPICKAKITRIPVFPLKNKSGPENPARFVQIL